MNDEQDDDAMRDPYPTDLVTHARHCCPIHGCKYEEPEEGNDRCPVVLGKVRREFDGGWCQEPFLTTDPAVCRQPGERMPSTEEEDEDDDKMPPYDCGQSFVAPERRKKCRACVAEAALEAALKRAVTAEQQVDRLIHGGELESDRICEHELAMQVKLDDAMVQARAERDGLRAQLALLRDASNRLVRALVANHEVASARRAFNEAMDNSQVAADAWRRDVRRGAFREAAERLRWAELAFGANQIEALEAAEERS
jgi:hypothetical protein